MSNVKNVLSIDMDYIMAPTINLYNDWIGSEQFQNVNAKTFWENASVLRDIDPKVEYDERKLLEIVDILATQCRRLDTGSFFFAKEHDMILTFLCGDDKKIGEIYNVYNIDHHHDIYYGPEQKEEIDRFDFTSLASWVYYLGKNSKVNKYYWIKNSTSSDFPIEESRELSFPFDDERYTDNVAALKEVDFDYVFVCMSSEYFPKRFNHFFEAMRKMVSSMKNHDFNVCMEDYCIGGKSRPIKG